MPCSFVFLWSSYYFSKDSIRNKKKKMSWSHLLIEGHCLFDKENENSKPTHCKYGIENISTNCLYDEKRGTICKYFGFKEAKSTLLLTNSQGKPVEFDSFDSSEKYVKKWKELEKERLNKWKRILDSKDQS